MALAVEEQKRRRERDSLQQMLMQQQQQDRVEQLGIEAIRAGGKLKDVEARYGTEASERGRASWRIFSDAQKRKEAEAESAAAAGPLIPNVQRLAVEAPNTEAYGRGVSSLAQMLGPRAAPILEAMSAQAQMAPTLGALDQMRAQEAFATEMDQKGRLEAQKQAIIARKEVGVYGQKKSVDRANQELDTAIAQQRTATVTPWVAGAIRAEEASGGSSAAGLASIADAAASIADPVERGVHIAHATRMWNIGREGREIAQRFDDTGTRIPKDLVNRLKNGTATQDHYTGLVLNVKPGTLQERSVAFVQGALESSARLRVALDRFSTKRSATGTAYFTGNVEKIAKSPFGAQDPDFANIVQARNSVLELLRRPNAGANLTKNEDEYYKSLIPGLEKLSFANGKLTPQSEALLRGMISHAETYYRANLSAAFPERVKSARLRARFDEARATAAEEYGPVSAAATVPGSVLIPARGQ
jgi:hypothetical protein